MVILFIVTWIILLILAVRLISTGWSAASDFSAVNFIESSKTITRPPHPELAEVQPGDELLVVNFTPDEEFINRVKESDNFLQQSLKDRIEEIEDDDDDDGGALVPAVR